MALATGVFKVDFAGENRWLWYFLRKFRARAAGAVRTGGLAPKRLMSNTANQPQRASAGDSNSVPQVFNSVLATVAAIVRYLNVSRFGHWRLQISMERMSVALGIHPPSGRVKPLLANFNGTDLVFFGASAVCSSQVSRSKVNNYVNDCN